MDMPKVVSREEWLDARRTLLAREKAWTRERDALSAARRQLPIVQIDKSYVFDGPDGARTLGDLFEGRRQLLVYHFMFDPEWAAGCPMCSFVVDHFGVMPEHLAQRDTSLAVISRAPLAKIEPFKARMGWNFPWLSSSGNDFNYDFHATTDDAHPEYNYQNYVPIAHEMVAKFKGPPPGEMPGLSVFFRDGANIFHTYSTYVRGLDVFMNTYNFLDHTLLGRQEDMRGGVSWIRHRDTYSSPA